MSLVKSPLPRIVANVPIVLSRYTKKEALWYNDPNYVMEKKNRLTPTFHNYFRVESKIPNAAKKNSLNAPVKLIDMPHVRQIIDSNPLADYDTLAIAPRSYIYGFSKRVGLVGFKAGMMTYFDHVTGKRHPVTVIRFENVQTIRATNPGARNDRGILNIDVGAGSQNPRHIKLARRKYYEQMGIPFKRTHMCFPITKDAILPPEPKRVAPMLFIHRIGKGFQGPMKRWGFKGLPASHGVSLAHRSHGATGCRQDPGRVLPGKKMAGRMGGKFKSVLKAPVLKVDTKYNCIYVRGPVPGHDSCIVRVKDSLKNPLFKTNPPPFPTYISNGADKPPQTLVADEKFYNDKKVPIKPHELIKLMK